MTPEERNLISGLFDRLSQASGQAKDAEADQLIRSKVAEVPAAPYSLVQSILVMQQALTNAQSRIAALEKQLSEASAAHGPQQGGGSFLAGVASLFGGGHPQPPRAASPPPPPPPPPQAPAQPVQPQAYGYPPPPPQPGGRGGAGGFLQGALSTAAGVAGGALLFQGIENLLGHNPGPFSGASTPSGGILGDERPVENTEIINYYNEGDENRGQLDQADTEQAAYTDPDPGPDPDSTTDYASDTTDDYNDLGSDDGGGGGGDDSSYV